MELRNINTFLHIAELHSFSRTARQLGYSQSAVSPSAAITEIPGDTVIPRKVTRNNPFFRFECINLPPSCILIFCKYYRIVTFVTVILYQSNFTLSSFPQLFRSTQFYTVLYTLCFFVIFVTNYYISLNSISIFYSFIQYTIFY